MFTVLEPNLLYWTVRIVLGQVTVVAMKVSLELSADQVSIAVTCNVDDIIIMHTVIMLSSLRSKYKWRITPGWWSDSL